MAETNNSAEKLILGMKKVKRPDGRMVFEWTGETVEKPEPTGYDRFGNPTYPKQDPQQIRKPKTKI